jgi:hypothetical protein
VAADLIEGHLWHMGRDRVGHRRHAVPIRHDQQNHERDGCRGNPPAVPLGAGDDTPGDPLLGEDRGKRIQIGDLAVGAVVKPHETRRPPDLIRDVHRLERFVAIDAVALDRDTAGVEAERDAVGPRGPAVEVADREAAHQNEISKSKKSAISWP